MSRLKTPLSQSNSRLAAGLRDLGFHPLAHERYLRRELVRTLTGLKTGIFAHADPRRLAGGPSA
ncbi:MAG: hypothetical protein EXR09_00830 [Acetobacteraceae bacterium]|nr:hypothetical protein [Acetobacteraceae bacterium]